MFSEKHVTCVRTITVHQNFIKKNHNLVQVKLMCFPIELRRFETKEFPNVNHFLKTRKLHSKSISYYSNPYIFVLIYFRLLVITIKTLFHYGERLIKLSEFCADMLTINWL